MEVEHKLGASFLHLQHLGCQVRDVRRDGFDRDEAASAGLEAIRDLLGREVAVAGGRVDEADLLECLDAPVEHAFDLELLDHRAAEDEARLLVDELGCDVGRDRRARNQRHAGLLNDRRERKDVAARHRTNDERNLVALHQPLDERNRLLRIGFVVIGNEFYLVLTGGGVILQCELHALQIAFAEVNDGRRPAQAHDHADFYVGGEARPPVCGAMPRIAARAALIFFICLFLPD